MIKSNITLVVLSLLTMAVVSRGADAQYGETQLDYFRPDVEQAAYGAGDACEGIGCGWTGCPADCACPSCRSWRTWADVEYLFWWSKGRELPPLVTTGGTGIIGDPGVQVLFGNERVGVDPRSGGRLTVGAWLDGCNQVGAGVRMFGMEGDSSGFEAASTGAPLLARPFISTVTGLENALLIASPGQNVGSINIDTSQDVLGSEVYLRVAIDQGRHYRVDMVGGYHYTRVDDGLNIFSETTALVPLGPFPANTVFQVTDDFDAQNDFHGGVLGLQTSIYNGCWTLTGLAKISFGNMRQTVSINGSTVITEPLNPSATSQGGLLALPTNIGEYARNEEAFIPEVAITLSRQVTDHLSLSVGYSFIYWSNIVLAGDQIDRTINPSQLNGLPLIGPARPEFAFRDTDFWLQGLNFGLHGTF